MNKVYRTSLTGGIIGAFTTSPKRALDESFRAVANDGEEVVFVLVDQINALQHIFYTLLLFMTFLLWCPAPGYLIITRPRVRSDGGLTPNAPSPQP